MTWMKKSPSDLVLEVHIPGPPQGKGRPRSARTASGAIIHYTPAKTRTYEGIVAALAASKMRGRKPDAGPIRLEIVAMMPVAKSWPQWKQDAAAAGVVAPTTKPDLDNIEKAICDALNGIAWQDDAQIVGKQAAKIYTAESPGVLVRVYRIASAPAAIKSRKEIEYA